MALFSPLSLDELKANDDDWPTDSSVNQELVEESFALCYDVYRPGSQLAKDAKGLCDEPEKTDPPEAEGSEAQVVDKDWVTALVETTLDKSASTTADVEEKTAPSEDPLPPATAFVRDLTLQRDLHVAYLRSKLASFADASPKTGINRLLECYHIVHSLCLLAVELTEAEKRPVIGFVLSCRSANGVFGTEHGQVGDLVSTYAAVMTLVSLEADEALASIDRSAVRQFLVTPVCQHQDGLVRLVPGGEAVVEFAYYASAIACVLGLDLYPEFKHVPTWLSKCQTYEGGFGQKPGVTAFAQHTYHAFAALCLLKRVHLADSEALAFYIARRQMRLEGGFQDCTCGLLDMASSYWTASLCPLVRRALIQASEEGDSDEEEDDDDSRISELGPDSDEPLHCCPVSLQACLLAYAQCPSGGFVAEAGEEPERVPAVSSTYFALSSLSTMQHYAGKQGAAERATCKADKPEEGESPEDTDHTAPLVVGVSANLLRKVDPLLGVCSAQLQRVVESSHS